jgi:ribosomal-protein-alanine N-acetyltransferase
MIGFIDRLFSRGNPVLSEAGVSDAHAIAALHSRSFNRGWSDGEIEQLLSDRSVLAHRACIGGHLAGFIMSRKAADEAEILSIAVEPSRRGRELGRRLLHLHLRQLAGAGVHSVFLEVGEDNVSACRLYRRAGFIDVGRREGYYPRAATQSVAALILRRDL